MKCRLDTAPVAATSSHRSLIAPASAGTTSSQPLAGTGRWGTVLIDLLPHRDWLGPGGNQVQAAYQRPLCLGGYL
jgi:hypothetical protein